MALGSSRQSQVTARWFIRGALVVLVGIGAGALRAQTLNEYAVPTADASPYNITSGPDGNLWFTEFASPHIGRITPAGVITEFATAGNTVGITTGPDGALWFTENLGTGAAKVGRMTTSGTVTNEFQTSILGASVADIVAGPDGNLWFTEFSKGKIGRCTTGGTITEFDVPAGINSEPLGIVSGPDGALWFTEFSGAATAYVGRITTAGSVTNEYPIGHGGEEIAVGPDNNLWFAEFPTAVGRMTTAGALTEFPTPLSTSGPRGVTNGPDGQIWFTEYGASRVGRVTGSGSFTEYPVGAGPRGIVTGPDGALWFTELDGNAIGQLTPGSFPFTATFISPTSGPAAGGTSDLLIGSGFLGGATVTVGGSPSSGASVDSANQITFGVPSLSPGAVYPVVVTNPDSSVATLPNAWFADFLDVPQASGFHPFVEKLVRDSVTAGCGAGDYCPSSSVTRAQMAVFLLRSKQGPTYAPPPCSAPVFNDVPCFSGFAPWIDQLAALGVTAGCGGGNYCPADPVTRAQMAVFLLRTHDGPGYTPPPCTSPTFADVPCTSGFAAWIDELALRGITAGCGGGNYCPSNPVTRGQMAVFLVTTFTLP